MILTTLTSADVRDRLAAILKQLHDQPQAMVITEQGRAEAVLLSIEQYESMIDLLEDREDESDMQLGRRLQEEREAYKRGDGRSFELFRSEIDA